MECGERSPIGGPLTAGPRPTDPLQNSITALTFSPDSDLLISSTYGYSAEPWPMWMFANPYAALCDEVGPLTAAQWQAYAPGVEAPRTCAAVPPVAMLGG